MKELLWKRAQLLQFERAKAAREKTSQANGSTGKTKPRGPPPKLGKPKSALEKGTQGQANGVKPKASQVCPILQTVYMTRFLPPPHNDPDKGSQNSDEQRTTDQTSADQTLPIQIFPNSQSPRHAQAEACVEPSRQIQTQACPHQHQTATPSPRTARKNRQRQTGPEIKAHRGGGAMFRRFLSVSPRLSRCEMWRNLKVFIYLSGACDLTNVLYII